MFKALIDNFFKPATDYCVHTFTNFWRFYNLEEKVDNFFHHYFDFSLYKNDLITNKENFNKVKIFCINLSIALGSFTGYLLSDIIAHSRIVKTVLSDTTLQKIIPAELETNPQELREKLIQPLCVLGGAYAGHAFITGLYDYLENYRY